MKTLIVYYSFTHNNELLARAIHERLDCDIHRIEEATKRTGLKMLLELTFNRKPRIKPHGIPVSSYDRFIFVAPVWAGKIATPLKSFLLQEKTHIHRYSFITLCGGGGSPQKEKLASGLGELLGREPESIEELWVSEVVSEDILKNIKSVVDYHIQPSDLDKFRDKIENFINELEASDLVKRIVS